MIPAAANRHRLFCLIALLWPLAAVSAEPPTAEGLQLPERLLTVPGIEEPVRLDDVDVQGQRGGFLAGDRRLGALKDELPCIGCGGLRLDGPPLSVRLLQEFGTYALKSFFQQPRVKGEPHDEALYQALRSARCQGDEGTSRCAGSEPNPGIYNWVADPEGGMAQYEFRTDEE